MKRNERSKAKKRISYLLPYTYTYTYTDREKKERNDCKEREKFLEIIGIGGFGKKIVADADRSCFFPKTQFL